MIIIQVKSISNKITQLRKIYLGIDSVEIDEEQVIIRVLR